MGAVCMGWSRSRNRNLLQAPTRPPCRALLEEGGGEDADALLGGTTRACAWRATP